MNQRSQRKFLAGMRKRLIATRKAKGYTQMRLAAETGMKESHIAQIERGFRNPTLITVHRLADGLGVSVSQLLKGL